MTEETQETPAEDTAPEQPQEPVAQETPAEPKPTAKDKLAEAVLDAPKKAAQAQEQLKQRLSPEDQALLAQLVESTTSKAVNDARDKWEERAKKLASDTYTQEEVQAQIQEALTQRDQLSAAYREYDKGLAKIGVLPDTPEYEKLDALVSDAIETGKLGAAALTDHGMIAAFAAAHGLGNKAPKSDDGDEAPASFVGKHTRTLSGVGEPGKDRPKSRQDFLKEKMLRDLNS